MRIEPVATDGGEADSADLVHVHIDNRLDGDQVSRLRAEGKRYLERGCSLVVHFEEGSFADAAGLRALIQLAKRSASPDDEPGLALISRSRAVDTLLQLCALPAYLPVVGSETEAREALTA